MKPRKLKTKRSEGVVFSGEAKGSTTKAVMSEDAQKDSSIKSTLALRKITI